MNSIHRMRRITAAALVLLSLASAIARATPSSVVKIEPTTPATLSVKAGDATLRFDPPETEEIQAKLKEGLLPEASPDPEKPIRLTPLYDPTRTHILGNILFAFQPETLSVTAENGTPYVRDTDFVYTESNGTIANKDGRMKGKVVAKAKAALQRLDLIQADASGKLSVKKGTSALVCPALPQPDAGKTAVAGIYIASWRAAKNPHFTADPSGVAGASEYAITRHEILPIVPLPPTEPVHPDRLSATLAKLREGKPVKIALMGDSIMLGAESTRWWNDKYDAESLTWKGRFIHGLRQRFPASRIDVAEAYRGGVTVAYGIEKLAEVLAQKPDLIIASFGVNDSDPKVGKKTPEEFGVAVAEIMDKGKAAGADVLYVTPFPLIPWIGTEQPDRLDKQFIPVMKQTADTHGAALVDVNTEYKNLNSHGIPWWSQNHNWHNHHGDFGHQVYAETVLRAFPAK